MKINNTNTVNFNFMKLICKKLYFILILCVKIITINIFWATISFAINYDVKQEDLSTLFNHKHDNFKAFEDLGIKFYIDDISTYSRIVEKANKELIDDKNFIDKTDKSINAPLCNIVNFRDCET